MRLPPWAALITCLTLGCAADPDPPQTEPVEDSCEGGLVRIDGACVVLQHSMEVLAFRTTTGPYVSTCTQRITSEDPGIDEAVIAESGGCRVIDTDRYGPPNFEPAARESGVVLRRADEVVPIDEADLFESCVERRTLPDGFLDFGGELAASFTGNATTPAFDATITVPRDPRFVRSPLTDGGSIVFSWSDQGADAALVVVAELPIQIVCEPSPAAERFEVPGELVAMLPESDPPGLEPITSIRMRNRVVLPFTEADAVVTLTVDAYQSAF